MSDVLLIRADGGRSIGLGHLMRCLALAQAWRDRGGDVVLATVDIPPLAHEMYADEGVMIQNLGTSEGSNPGDTLRIADDIDAVAIVVDGYHLGTEHADALSRGGAHVALIDDMGSDTTFAADIVVNQNLGARSDMYPNASGKLLIGPEFALLRREFVAEPATLRPAQRNLLVTVGGGSDENALGSVLDALSALDDLQPVCRVTPGLLDPPDLERAPGWVTIGSKDMASELAWASLAISAAGSTCWELCRFGVPMVLLTLSPDQKMLAHALSEQGCALSVGEPTAMDAGRIADAVRGLFEEGSLLASMSEKCRALVDGRGAARVTDAIAAAGKASSG